MKSVIFKLVGMVFLFSSSINAIEINGTLAKMPVYAESKDKGVLVDLVNAIAKESNNKIDIKVLPFSSSLNLVIFNKKDFHMPLIKNDVLNENELKYYYSTDTIFHVNFVIYSKKDKDINTSNISNFKVETDRAHVEYFPFEVIASNSIEKSLEKVNSGEIDAFIFADFATDPYLKKMDNANIKRELYKRFESKIVFPKNEKGKQMDAIFIEALAKLRSSGKLEQIIAPIDTPFDNWQP
ncbi:MAG: transporter substrate-binding domain-containing protein [Aliarcobacter sp.]|nr:transporter substrate-binding domain-containing protein [Aliarcobacter sp.]